MRRFASLISLSLLLLISSVAADDSGVSMGGGISLGGPFTDDGFSLIGLPDRDLQIKGDVLLIDNSPHTEWCDSTDGTAWQIHYDQAETFSGLTFWPGSNGSCTSGVGITNQEPTLELASNGNAFVHGGLPPLVASR